MKTKLIVLLVILTCTFLSALEAQTFDSDKPEGIYNKRYQQNFNPEEGWNNVMFYKFWSTLQPNIFRASDISAGYLQFVWIEKRVICSRKSFDAPYILEAELDYALGSNRAGIVFRIESLTETIQEPESDPGFNRHGIALYPTADGSSMIVQFSGEDRGYNSGMDIQRILVPKPDGVENLRSRATIRVEDFGTVVYVYHNNDPFIRIDMDEPVGNYYTSGTVYDSSLQQMGTFSGMKIELWGKVAVAQRDATLRLYRCSVDYYEDMEPIDYGDFRDLYVDAWVATDALGRDLPSYEEVGPVKDDQRRVVGIFYITWHTPDHHTNFKKPYSADVSKVLKADPAARLDGNHPLWTENSYHWGEPEMGYFLSQDEYVIRRDMNLLAMAGVDLIILDVTNAVRYWNEWEVLFNTMERMKAEGNKVPQFCFWAFNGPVITVVQELYEWFYKYPQYEDLWFYWDNKPLLLYNGNPSVDATGVVYQNPNPNYDPAARTDRDHPHYMDPDYADEFYSDYTQEVKDFFTLRTMWWGYYEWAGERFVGTEGNWSFGYDLAEQRVRAMYPDDLVSPFNGKKEQAAVTPAQHPSSLVGKSWRRQTGQPPLNQYDKVDEAYVPWLGKTVKNPEGYGIYFQDRWDEALASDPQFIYINDWNEWTAGKYPSASFNFMRRNSNFFFVDQYNAEFNRCVQPMKGGYTDNYFMQMVQNIRRYKGIRPAPDLTGHHQIQVDGDFSEWTSVENVFHDHKGDTRHRNHNGYGGLTYVDDTGRNDILTSKVSFDDQTIYFYVKTNDNLTPYTDPHWMLLFLDVDRNKGTGWEGYDFIVNHEVLTDSTTTVKRWTGRSWEDVAEISYRAIGNQMELAIPRSAVLLPGEMPEFYFKWADNIQHIDDITAFFTGGDVAPDRRFNYNFSMSPLEVRQQSPYRELHIPGEIGFEDFDHGGPGVAYVDADIINNGGMYRLDESVDIARSDDGRYYVSWINTGEWIKYTVNVNGIGTYKMSIHYAAQSEGNKIVLDFDDKIHTDTLSLPATGGSHTWDEYSIDIRLPAGQKEMTLSIIEATDGLSLDKLVFSELHVAYPGNGDGLVKSMWLGSVGGRNWFTDSICSEISPRIDEVWDGVGPGCGIRADFWNIRWTGFVEALFSEEYTFYLTANDLGRLWINDYLLIDGWTSASTNQTLSARMNMVAGEKVRIRVDYAKRTHDAMIKFEWESDNNPREVVPQAQLYTTSGDPTAVKQAMPVLHLYPNPARNRLSIDSSGQLMKAIVVLDIYGRMVDSYNEPVVGNRTIDISHLPAGVYFLKVIGENRHMVMRFVCL